MNEQAVHMALMFGLAIGADIAPFCAFARKNYFYPDLPKGYQISQYEHPIVGAGQLSIPVNGEFKAINITRAHLEEDAGKSIHDLSPKHSAIDLNRAGMPLLEIVSEPELQNAEQAAAYFKTLHTLVTYLNICSGDLAQGAMRCDANVSIRPKGQSQLGTRTEIKNINSFRNIEKAINYEIARQIDTLESGGRIIQETRLYDADKDETRSIRSKEEANDYRYFPDPDLLPVKIEQTLLDTLKKNLPELPQDKLQRFKVQYQLSNADAQLLVQDQKLADYYENTVRSAQGESKLCANWVTSELCGRLYKEDKNITQSPIKPEYLGKLVERIADQTISGKIAKMIFNQIWQNPDNPDHVIQAQGLKQVTDLSAIESIVQEVIQDSPKQVKQYQEAPEHKQKKLLGYFVGQIMKRSQGKANPGQVNQVLLQQLNNTDESR